MREISSIYDVTNHSSEWCNHVKIHTEVELVWLEYDVDDSGYLDFSEVSKYLKEKAYPLLISDKDKRAIFNLIDKDGSGSVDPSGFPGWYKNQIPAVRSP